MIAYNSDTAVYHIYTTAYNSVWVYGCFTAAYTDDFNSDNAV